MGECFCRICGLYIEDKPWGEDGLFPTYEVCPCCGVEFGYEDCTVESVLDYRERCITNGTKWSNLNQNPVDWILKR